VGFHHIKIRKRGIDMEELIKFIESITPFTVDKDKLFKFCYVNKEHPSRLYFKLITASRLTRQDYLEEFMQFEETRYNGRLNNV
jgi:hypothetical protein